MLSQRISSICIQLAMLDIIPLCEKKLVLSNTKNLIYNLRLLTCQGAVTREIDSIGNNSLDN